MKPTLHVPDGRQVEVVHDLVIGRVASCGLVLKDEKVSRRHARLIVEAGVIEVEDLGSRNGVLLNGKPVSRRMLRDGDVLQIGRTELEYREGAGAGAIAGSGADPLAGEDLFAGDDLLGGEEAAEAPETKPRAAQAPAPAPAEPTAPAPSRTDPAPAGGGPSDPGGAPGDRDPQRAAGEDEVDVIEFVDEVVEVRKPKSTGSTPAAAPSGFDDGAVTRRAPSAAAAARKPAAAKDAAARSGGVLQFSKREAQGGLLGDDLDQLAGTGKLLRVLLALAVAGALGYGAYLLAA